jgi:hypothetical protein
VNWWLWCPQNCRTQAQENSVLRQGQDAGTCLKISCMDIQRMEGFVPHSPCLGSIVEAQPYSLGCARRDKNLANVCRCTVDADVGKYDEACVEGR